MATIDTRYYDNETVIKITGGATLNAANSTILIVDSAGVDVDLTLYNNVKLLVKNELIDSDESAILSFDSGEGQIILASGSFYLVRAAADTDKDPGEFKFAMKGNLISTGAETPIDRGTFIIDPKGIE